MGFSCIEVGLPVLPFQAAAVGDTDESPYLLDSSIGVDIRSGFGVFTSDLYYVRTKGSYVVSIFD